MRQIVKKEILDHEVLQVEQRATVYPVQ